MKSVLLGCVSATLVAVAAWAILTPAQTPVTTAYSTEGVRLTDSH